MGHGHMSTQLVLVQHVLPACRLKNAACCPLLVGESLFVHSSLVRRMLIIDRAGTWSRDNRSIETSGRMDKEDVVSTD